MHDIVAPKRGTPSQPAYRMTVERDVRIPMPDEVHLLAEIEEYPIEVREICHVFKAGHRIRLVVKGQDSRRECSCRRYRRRESMNRTRSTGRE